MAGVGVVLNSHGPGEEYIRFSYQYVHEERPLRDLMADPKAGIRGVPTALDCPRAMVMEAWQRWERGRAPV
jgi:hypothetical protein